jgi:hypothetical protein
MKRSYMIILFLIITLTGALSSQEVRFTPPEGWRLAEADQLPPHVQMMVMGKGKLEYPPSMNLSTEEYHGTLQEYLQIVKNINQKKGSEWKDLGLIKTKAGEASLSQVNVRTKWGPVRMMHVILVKDDHVYILTAAALQSEFSANYKSFLESLRSLDLI